MSWITTNKHNFMQIVKEKICANLGEVIFLFRSLVSTKTKGVAVISWWGSV